MDGLAQQSAMQSPMGAQAPSVEDIVNLLMQGVDPNDLVKQGIPIELIQQAIEMIMAQQNQSQVTNSQPNTGSGLAMQASRGM